MPRFGKEIITTAVTYIVLCLLWFFFLGRFINLSDQGLSTIAVALSAIVGGFTAIIISFALIVWQFSRKERNDSFIHWRETLDQLDQVFQENMESVKGMLPELIELLLISHRVSAVNPMPIKKMNELFNNIEEKLQQEKFKHIEVCRKISNLLTPLLNYGFEHIDSNQMYLTILNLRGLFYRLMSILAGGIIIVTLVPNCENAYTII